MPEEGTTSIEISSGWYVLMMWLCQSSTCDLQLVGNKVIVELCWSHKSSDKDLKWCTNLRKCTKSWIIAEKCFYKNKTCRSTIGSQMTGPPILEVIEFRLLLPSTASPSSFQNYDEIRLPSILSEPHGPHPSPVKETQSRIAGTAKQVCFLFRTSVYICVFLTSFRLRRNPAREKRIILTFPRTFPTLQSSITLHAF